MSTPISSASAPEALPEKPGGRHTGLIIAAIIIVLAIMASIIFAVAKNTGRDSAADGKTTVKIGTTEAANDYWNVIKKKAAARASISTLSALTTTPSLTWRCPRDR